MKKLLLTLLLLSIPGMLHAVPMTIGDVIPLGPGSYSITTGAGVSDASVESFIGLAGGTLDGLGQGDATEGSAIKDSVYITAGETFSFDWYWDSNESNPAPYVNDFAFYALSMDGVGVIANTFSPDGTTGTFSWMATSTGTLGYAIGAMDVGDTVVDSWIKVTNFSTHGEPVPEPATMLLLGTGIAGLVGSRMRRKK